MKIYQTSSITSLAIAALFGLSTLAFADQSDPKKDDANKPDPAQIDKPTPKKEDAKKPDAKSEPKKGAPHSATASAQVTIAKDDAGKDEANPVCPKCGKPCPLAGKPCPKCDAAQADSQMKAETVREAARESVDAVRKRMGPAHRGHEKPVHRPGLRDERPMSERAPEGVVPLQRAFHLGEAARHLHAAGAHEQAEAVEGHLKELREHMEREIRENHERTEMRERAMREIQAARESGVKEMRAVLEELRKAVEQLSKGQGGH